MTELTRKRRFPFPTKERLKKKEKSRLKEMPKSKFSPRRLLARLKDSSSSGSEPSSPRRIVVYDDVPHANELDFSILHELTHTCVEARRDDELIKILELYTFDFDGIPVKKYWDLIYTIRKYAYKTGNVTLEIALQEFERCTAIDTEINFNRESILWSIIPKEDTALRYWHRRRIQILYRNTPRKHDFWDSTESEKSSSRFSFREAIGL